MCDQELLVGYLYDEMEPGDRRAFEAHLATCGECRAEVKALRATRGQLAGWAPPEPGFDFHIVRGAARPAAPVRRWIVSPAWGLAAAAVLVMAAASAIANLDIRYGAEGLTVRTGWNRTVQQPAVSASASAAPAAAAVDTTAELRAQLRAVTARLTELEAAATRPNTTPVRVLAPAGAVDMRSVQRLLADSEERQQQQLAVRVGQVNRDVDAKLRGYADAFQRGLQQVQGLTDTTIIRQREMENHLSRVVLQQPK